MSPNKKGEKANPSGKWVKCLCKCLPLTGLQEQSFLLSCPKTDLARPGESNEKSFGEQGLGALQEILIIPQPTS